MNIVRTLAITGQLPHGAVLTLLGDNQGAASLAAGRLSAVPEMRAVYLCVFIAWGARLQDLA